jgi:protein phosphatase 1 regulatory subunit 7
MEKENTPPDDNSKGWEKPHQSPTNSKGWDGKLRVDRRPVLENPEAISDPEYSDEEHVVPGEEISADEGIFYSSQPFSIPIAPIA